MLAKEEKVRQVEQLSEDFSKSKGSFLVNCIGLNVETMTAFRKHLKSKNSDIKVIRNTLASRALENHEEMKKAYESHLEGPNAFVLVFDKDISQVAKVINEVEEEHESFKIKCGLLEGNLISSEEVKSLAKLPSQDVLRAQLVSVLEAPLVQWLRLCKEVPAGLLRVLKNKQRD